MLIRHILIIYCLLLACSCGSLVKNRIKNADTLAINHAFKKEIIKTDNFSLLTYSKIANPKTPLHIYIEGDGFAWRSKYSISSNPTPKNPVSLKLAATDTSPNILYIARPCQYVSMDINISCDNKFWTGSRFSESVIHSTNDVVNSFVKKYGFTKVKLFGYSGGAAVAVLVAAMRDDVALIGTVAGNLNHKLLMEEHNVSPLSDSLDAIDVVESIKNIPQFHLVGAKDNIVLPKIIMSFAMRVNLVGGQAKFKIIDNANHHYEKWPQVWKKALDN